jgi:hypothetical protein
MFLTVGFTSDKTGLATVGFRLYNPDGTPNGSRTTTGVIELGGGDYGAPVTVPVGFTGYIAWDTGGGSPQYRYANVQYVEPTPSGFEDWTAPLDAAGTRTAVGLAAANLDTQLGTLATAAALATVDGVVDDILVDTGTTIPTQITGLNNLSAAQVNAEVDTALADYDPPTKAELDAGLAALEAHGDADWATATGFSTHSAADVWAVATRELTAFGFTVSTNANATETAIKAKTDLLPADPAGVSNIPTAAQIATAWGVRVLGNGRTADYFLKGGFNKTTRTANSLTVTDTDDTTVLASGALTQDGALNPIASVDPT